MRAEHRAAGLVALATFIVFATGIGGDFVFDDKHLIVVNPYVQSPEHALRAFTTHLWDNGASKKFGFHYYRPFVTLSYLINWVTSDGQPWVFHTFNVVCHALASYLAVILAYRWIGELRGAIVAGLIFALHPTRAEVVHWIAGRTDAMMALFGFGAVLLAARADGVRRSGARAGWLAAASVAYVLALGSKESAVVVPLFVGLDAACAKSATSRRFRLRFAFATGAVSAVYLGARALVYPVRPDAELEPTPLHALKTVVNFAERVVVPWPQTFFLRPIMYAEDGSLQVSTPVAVLGAALLVGSVGLLVALFRRDRCAAGIATLGFALLVPVCNFVYVGRSVQTGNDRFLYVPLFFVACAVLRVSGAGRALSGRAASLAVAGVAVVWAAIIGLRALDFRSPEALWAHELDVDPDNPAALQHLGEIAGQAGDLELAARLFAEALEEPSTRYVLLAPPGDQLANQIRLLRVEGMRTADGDVRALRALDVEWTHLLEGTQSRQDGHVGYATLGRRFPADVLEVLLGDAAPNFAGDAAMIAARLGDASRTRRLLARADFTRAPFPEQLVLSYARVGDFDEALNAIRRLRAGPWGNESSYRALEQLIRRARETYESASKTYESAVKTYEIASVPYVTAVRLAAEQRATALADVGAYLGALRVLRDVYLPDRPEQLAQLYVQLLVAAGLVDEAKREAQIAFGIDAGLRAVGAIQAQLAPTLSRLRPVVEPSPWWKGP